MSLQVSYKKQFLFGILMLLVILLSVEGVLRIVDYYNPNCNFMNSSAFDGVEQDLKRKICLDNDSLKWNATPYLHLEPNQNLETISVNQDGFRGQEINNPKLSNSYRIFLVGGSTAFGVGSTSNDSTISGHLQNFFNDNQSEKIIEIINAGIPKGYSFTEINYIKNKILYYEPDMIIVYDGWNDINRPLSDYELNVDNVFMDKFLRYIITNDFYKTGKVLLKTYFSTQNNDNSRIDVFDSYGMHQKVELWKNGWNEFCSIKNDYNLEIIITLQPLVGSGQKILTDEEQKHYDKSDHKNLLIYYEQYGQSLDQINNCTTAVDLRNVFDEFNDTVFFDSGHVGDLGNRIIAEKLYETIIPYL